MTSMKALGDTEILIDYDEKGHLTGTTDAAAKETVPRLRFQMEPWQRAAITAQTM